MRRLLLLALYGLAAFLTVPLLLLGLVLLFALGLAAAGGLFWGLGCLLFGRWSMGLESLGIGAGAFIAIVLIWDRLFALRDAARRRGIVAPAPVRASALRIDFDR